MVSLNDRMFQLSPEQRAMVDNYQCPGCLHGANTNDCVKFAPKSLEFRECDGFRCSEHRASTFGSGVGRFNLGLPRGFCRVLYVADRESDVSNIRLFTVPPTYDRFNVPVWAMEFEGSLLVRCFCPRTDKAWVDVIRGAKMAGVCPNAIDVGQFFDEID